MCKRTKSKSSSHSNSQLADSLPLANPPTSNPVAWQTCVWILIALALNTMTQPCGTICGIPSKYRFYMRSSPLLCLFDGLSLFIRLIVVSIRFEISAVKSLRIIVAERFEDEDPLSLADATWFRWLTFILGPLPATIKLSTFRGTPLTKFLGLCYVISFLLVEVLIRLSLKAEILTKADVTAHSVQNDPAYHRICHKLFSLDLILFCVSYCVPIAIWIYSGVWGFGSPAHPSPILAAGVLYISMAKPWCQGIYWIYARLSRLGVNLMDIFPSGIRSQLCSDELSVYAFFSFLMHLHLAVSIYWEYFDSNGTENPDWTSVFGK